MTVVMAAGNHTAQWDEGTRDPAEAYSAAAGCAALYQQCSSPADIFRLPCGAILLCGMTYGTDRLVVLLPELYDAYLPMLQNAVLTAHQLEPDELRRRVLLVHQHALCTLSEDREGVTAAYLLILTVARTGETPRHHPGAMAWARACFSYCAPRNTNDWMRLMTKLLEWDDYYLVTHVVANIPWASLQADTTGIVVSDWSYLLLRLIFKIRSHADNHHSVSWEWCLQSAPDVSELVGFKLWAPHPSWELKLLPALDVNLQLCLVENDVAEAFMAKARQLQLGQRWYTHRLPEPLLERVNWLVDLFPPTLRDELWRWRNMANDAFPALMATNAAEGDPF